MIIIINIIVVMRKIYLLEIQNVETKGKAQKKQKHKDENLKEKR